jgi:hypothetical protein
MPFGSTRTAIRAPDPSGHDHAEPTGLGVRTLISVSLVNLDPESNKGQGSMEGRGLTLNEHGGPPSPALMRCPRDWVNSR